MALPAATARFKETPPDPNCVPRCPKCGEKVVRRSHARGIVRWSHRNRRGNHKPGVCNWNGTRPVGGENAESAGIPRAKVERIHAKILGADGVQRYVITSAQNATPVHKRF